MNRHEQRRFAARQDALETALDFVEAFCTVHAVARDDMLRLRLMVEELFSNSITHGHGGGADVDIEIALQRLDRGVELHYADPGLPFDPRSGADPGHVEAHADERPVGGLGVHLLLELAAEVDYHHDGTHNRLRLRLDLA
jgi:serine/threonine-protein kinase RsbW